MSVARLNGSHNTLDWHKIQLNSKRVLPNCPILLEFLEKNKNCKLKHEPSFKVGDILILTTKTNFDGTKKISLTNKKITSIFV